MQPVVGVVRSDLAQLHDHDLVLDSLQVGAALGRLPGVLGHSQFVECLLV